jgi:hypothetical protein
MATLTDFSLLRLFHNLQRQISGICFKRFKTNPFFVFGQPFLLHSFTFVGICLASYLNITSIFFKNGFFLKNLIVAYLISQTIQQKHIF